MQDAAASALPDNAFEIVAALTFAAILAAAIALIAGGSISASWRRSRPGRQRARQGAGPPGPAAGVRAVGHRADLSGPGAGRRRAAKADLRGERLGQWVARTGLRVGVILLLAITASRLVAAIIARAEREMGGGTAPGDLERQKRAQTIGRTFSRFLSAIVWGVALLMALRALDVDITPVLTGAGILGLAVGFGAQTLVKDIISGFFLIVEDQVRVGDVALVNGIGGAVEQINLRTLVMRDLEGTVHVIPHGALRTLSNRSKNFAFCVFEVGIDYEDDIDRAIEVVRAVAEGMRQDAAMGPLIVEPLEVQGVERLGASSVDLRFRLKTVPLSQWAVGRELRKRVKQAFDREGIRIPFQQVVVSNRQ